MTQLAMNQCAGSDLKAAETRMAALLKKLGVSSDDPAQKAWEAYRDAQLEAIYPKENTGEFGWVDPMCFAKDKTALVKGRISDLNALITPGEGDVCSGLKSIAARRRNGLSAIPVKYSPPENRRRVSGSRSSRCSAVR